MLNVIKEVIKTLLVSAGLLLLLGVTSPSSAKEPGHHKLQVNDRALGQQLADAGARLIADYGGYQLYDAPDSTTNLPPDKAGLRDDYNMVLLNAARLDTTASETKALRKTVGAFEGKRLHMVQFAGPPLPAWRQSLLDAGVQIVNYIPQNAYLVYGDAPSIGRVQALAAAAPHVQWEAAFLDDYKIHPAAKPGRVKTDQFAIQLIADAAANADTLALIDRLKLAPLLRHRPALDFVNVVGRFNAADLAQLAARPDVISIQPYGTPHKWCERQDQIVAGNLSANAPSGPGYLGWLLSHGFTQTNTDFAVDMSDSGIDDGTTHPNHFGLYVQGNTSYPSRVIYNRLEGTRNPGSTIMGCDGHGNLNAHIVGGYHDGTGFPFADTEGYHYGLGVCPFVSLGSSVIFDPTNWTEPSYEDLMSQAYHSGSRICNNSWGDSDVQAIYNSDSQEYDALVRDAQPSGSTYPVSGNQEMVIVFAAGNDGPDSHSVSAPATAKNVITVGGSQNVQPFNGDYAGADGSGVDNSQADNANSVLDFSSEGPCEFGRQKPDLVAPATHVSGGAPQAAHPGADGTALTCFLDMNTNDIGVSGGSDGSYFYPDTGQQFYTASSGTSHSTPCVSGGCALVRQYFINQGWTPPSPAMTKAWLMNSARYLTGDYANDDLWSPSQGMGEMDLGTAFDGTPRLLHDEWPSDMFTSSGQTRVVTGGIYDPTKPFRVTLAWTDAPGSTSGAPYNNDLDLTVVAGGSTYKGNVFSGAFSVTGGSADRRNNVESVFLPAGVSGNFTVTVTAASINSVGVPGASASWNQDFALVVYNATNSSGVVTVPAPIIVSPINGFSTNNGSFIVSGTGEAGGMVSIYDGPNIAGSGIVGSAGEFHVAVGLSDGAHALTATESSSGAVSPASATVNITLFLKPVITVQPPASLAGFLKETLALSAGAYGAVPIHYQWEKDGLKIPGATSTNLKLANLVAGSAAGYQMVASNRYGSTSSSNCELTLVPNPFGALTGAYYGLFAESNAQFESTGSLKLTLGALGTFTGTILNAGGTYAFSGSFSAEGATRVSLAPFTVNMNLDLTNGTEQVLGTVSNASWNAALQAGRAAFAATNPFPAHGKYTMVFTNAGNGSDSPGGDCFGTVNISAAGLVAWSGWLADNTFVLPAAVGISKFVRWPVYIPLYGKLGSLAGWVALTNNTLTGAAIWFRTGPYGKLYPAGFTNPLVVVGSTFTPGNSKSPVLVPTNQLLTLSGAGLGSNMSRMLDLYDTGKFVTNNGVISKLTLSVAPATGVITGTFLDPETQLMTPIKGMVLQEQGAAAGYFAATNATGLFLLTPQP